MVIVSAQGSGASWEVWFGFKQMFTLQEWLAEFLSREDMLLRSHIRVLTGNSHVMTLGYTPEWMCSWAIFTVDHLGSRLLKEFTQSEVCLSKRAIIKLLFME